MLFHGRSLKYILTYNKDAFPEVIISLLGLVDGEAAWEVGLALIVLSVVRSVLLTGRVLVQRNFYQKIPKLPQSKVLLTSVYAITSEI